MLVALFLKFQSCRLQTTWTQTRIREGDKPFIQTLIGQNLLNTLCAGMCTLQSGCWHQIFQPASWTTLPVCAPSRVMADFVSLIRFPVRTWPVAALSKYKRCLQVRPNCCNKSAVRSRECLWSKADSLLLLSLCNSYPWPQGFECQQSVIVSNWLFLSLIKCGGIGKLQSAVSSCAPAQPREGVPKTWAANKLLDSTTNAVGCHTSCTHAQKAVPEPMCGITANSPGIS